jgi:hypothetical protein
MATRQGNNRVILYKRLKTITPKKGDHIWSMTPGPILGTDVGLNDFINDNFNSQANFEELYYKLTKTITSDGTFAVDPQDNSLEDFYGWFACDLKWAQGTQACIDAANAAKAQPQVQPKQPKQQAQPQQPEQPKQQAQPQQQVQQQTTERPNLNFHQCQGTYTPGCVNTDAIAQVQRCLDLTTPRHPRGSGYYDYILHDKLSAMGFKNGFTDADVSKICDMDSTKTKPFQTQENEEPGQSEETPRQTYEKYYAKLDGKETNRVKLKLSNLPDNDLQNLNKYFATQGLYKIKNPKRRYGTKFVWGKKP